jgi:hypothetical protein
LFPELLGEAIQVLAPALVELLLNVLRPRATDPLRAAVHRGDDQASVREPRSGDTEFDRRSIAAPGVVSDQDGLGHGAIIS